MSRWRNTCPDKVSKYIDEINESRFYLLRQIGPTGFLIKEDASNSQFKVLLGDPHSCSCVLFSKEKELCKHILWILMKKLRLNKDNQMVFQLGLCERDLQNILSGSHNTVEKKVLKLSKTVGNDESQLKQKDIDKEDVCPICQESLHATKKDSLIFCRFGCGNSIHPTCMKIWADHQHKSTGDDNIKCPLCRTEFGNYQFIINEYHKQRNKKKQIKKSKEISCSKCCSKISRKNRFRCATCKNVWLCNTCVNTQFHIEHEFEEKNIENKRWEKYDRFHLMLQFTQYPLDVKTVQSLKNNRKPAISHSAPSSLQRKQHSKSSFNNQGNECLDMPCFSINGRQLREERIEGVVQTPEKSFLPAISTSQRGLINAKSCIREFSRKNREQRRKLALNKNETVNFTLDEVMTVSRCSSG